MRLVTYSLAVRPGSSCQWQLLQSVRSLRHYNSTVPVQLVLYGEAEETTLDEADRLNVRVLPAGPFGACFAALPPGPAAVLARIPTLHKLPSLRHCPAEGIDQVLCLDCDTFFFGDVDRLLARHRACHWYAREEPMSARSAEGAHPEYLDEALLRDMALSERLVPVPPYNTGMILLNGGVWRQIGELCDAYLATAWRLAVGLRFRSPLGNDADHALLEAVGRCATARDRAECLPYPCRNSWVLDEVAAWLTLGRIPGLTHDVLSRSDAAQNGECLAGGANRVAAHYFGAFESRFFETVPAL